MLPACCKECKEAVPVADGHSVIYKCSKENQWVQHTNCLMHHAIEYYLFMSAFQELSRRNDE